MRQLNFNHYERIVTQDLNNAQLAVGKSLQDDFLYNFVGKSNGVLGSSFIPTYTSALVASIAAGVGFFYDSSQTGYNPNYRMIMATTAATANLAAANTQDRIDLVVLAPNFITTATAQRYIKQGGVGPIVLTTVNKDNRDSYTLTVVQGTPGVTPTAPATPAGSILIAQCYVHANTGMASSADVTDSRAVLTFAVSNSGHSVATATTLQGQLDQLDTGISRARLVNGTVSVSTSTYAMTSTQNGVLFLVDSTSNAVQINLPAASAFSGKVFDVLDISRKFGTHALTLHRAGTEFFNGVQADYVCKQNAASLTVFSDGTKWYILSTGKPNLTRITAATYTISPDDQEIEVDCTSNNVVMTLPALSTVIGQTFCIDKMDNTANTITINCAGSDTFSDGTTTYVLDVGYQSQDIKCGTLTFKVRG